MVWRLLIAIACVSGDESLLRGARRSRVVRRNEDSLGDYMQSLATVSRTDPGSISSQLLYKLRVYQLKLQSLDDADNKAGSKEPREERLVLQTIADGLVKHTVGFLDDKLADVAWPWPSADRRGNAMTASWRQAWSATAGTTDDI